MQPIRNQSDRSNNFAAARSHTDEVTGALANLTVSKEVEPKIPAPKCCMRAANSSLLHPLTPTQDKFSHTANAHQTLFSAAKNNNTAELLDALHHPFVNINQLDEFDKTPLYYAVIKMNVDAVRILRQHGAADATGGFEQLTEMCFGDRSKLKLDERYTEILDLLFQPVEQVPVNSKFGKVDPADCDALDKQGNTPLHLNVQSGDVNNVIAFCLSSNRQGADLREMVNRQNNQGDTPLHVVMKISDAKKRDLMCRALLERGADPSIKNHAKNRPYDLTDDTFVLKSLEKHGCHGAPYKRVKLEKKAEEHRNAAERAARDQQERDAKRLAENQRLNTQG
jgi:ankyrin repeat protein